MAISLAESAAWVRLEPLSKVLALLADTTCYFFHRRPLITESLRQNHRTVQPIDDQCIERLWLYSVNKADLIPGTLDMLILTTLKRAPLHGYGIAQSIKRISDDVLTVEEGSLYPALQRLLLQGWVKAEWKTTETNRRARFYTLTTAGRKHLGLDVSQFRQMMAAISRVLEDAEEAG